MTVYAQANIVALLDKNGSAVVKCRYAALGNCKVLNADGSMITDDTYIGILNPFRYRGYYYDEEIGLYYLQSRYYDASVVVYCINNPISHSDNSGQLAQAIFGAIINGFLHFACTTLNII